MSRFENLEEKIIFFYQFFFILNNKDLIAAPWTPMNGDQSVNYDAISEYGNVLLKQGVKNVYINGTTGEGMSLSVEERKKCAEKWMKTGMDIVITHVGANSIVDVKTLGIFGSILFFKILLFLVT